MRGALLAVCLVLSACGGGGADQPIASSEPAPQAPAAPVAPVVQSEPAQADQPAAPVVQPVQQPEPPATCAPVATTFAAERAKLSHWFAGGIAGKRIVLVGDSTSSQMGPVSAGGLPNLFDDFLAMYVTPDGAPLHGVSVSMLAASGDTLANYAAHDSDFSSGTGLYATTQTAASLIVFSYGINDVRQGAADVSAIVANLRKVVNTIRAAKPTTDIVLRIPNPILSTDTGQHYVQPNAEAQRYSNILRDAYRTVANEWPNVAVYDEQALLFGETSPAASECMADQLHPNAKGYGLIYQQLAGLLAP